MVSETQALLPLKICPGIFEEASNALHANCWLDLDYKNTSGRWTQAEVMALGLAQRGPRNYLVCRFLGFANERSLALHRIISDRALTRTFERPKEFDLKKYDDDGRFGFGEGKRITITFRIDKAAGYHLLESPLSEDQQVLELDDAYEITATVVESEWLWRLLRGFGDEITHSSNPLKM